MLQTGKSLLIGLMAADVLYRLCYSLCVIKKPAEINNKRLNFVNCVTIVRRQ